jgi:hypothetical protein
MVPVAASTWRAERAVIFAAGSGSARAIEAISARLSVEFCRMFSLTWDRNQSGQNVRAPKGEANVAARAASISESDLTVSSGPTR